MENPFFLQVRGHLSTTYTTERLLEYIGHKPKDVILTRNQILDRAANNICNDHYRRSARATLDVAITAEILEILRRD